MKPQNVMNLKVLSWNIWVDGYIDKWLDFLQRTDPDIIGLQEVKEGDPRRDIIQALQKRGYHFFFARNKQTWEGGAFHQGPAIFSRLPILGSEKILLGSGADERATAYVKISVQGTVLHVFSIHLLHTHQRPSPQQEEQTKKLIFSLPKNNVIVMGDFNATPDSNSIQAISKVLTNTDPSSLPTWSVYPAGCLKCNPVTVDTKLDYIFISRDLQSYSFTVGKSDGSDHLPITAQIQV